MDFKLGLVVLCTVIPIVNGFSKSEKNRRIVNGKVIPQGAWPFLVSLHYKEERLSKMKHTCGGTLIHPRWVLTAAHCFMYSDDYSKPENWNVVVGEYNQFAKDVGEQVIEAEEFFVHPDFTDELRSDIALIKLKKEAIVGNNYAQPIAMDDRNNLKLHSDCKIGGWGQVSAKASGWGMYIPLEATVYITDIKECRKRYNLFNLLYALSGQEGQIKIDESWLCAEIPLRNQSTIEKQHGGTSGICNGDSGGPLICKYNKKGDYVVSGVISAAPGCGSSIFPDAFTKVSYFREWILSVIKSNTPDWQSNLAEIIAYLLRLL